MLRVSDRGYGLLLAGAAIDSILGGLVNAAVVARIGALPALLAALGANVFIFAAIGISPNAAVLDVLLALNGFATIIWSVVTVSMRQHMVPSDLLGRVNSAYRMVGWGLMPLGALAGTGRPRTRSPRRLSDRGRTRRRPPRRPARPHYGNTLHQHGSGQLRRTSLRQ
ncbi:MAG TPA: hypothetical protein VGM79_20375 [Streptosporangiaceae bacterium]